MKASLFKTARSILLFTFLAATLMVVPLAGAVFPGQNGKLAFHLAGEVWVAGADGANRVQLSRPGFDRSPSWSPDGTKIVFSGNSKIVVMNHDGSDQRQLTFGAPRDRTTAWTVDGRQVVYDREFVEIYVVNADGSGGERKVTDGLMPATSPYGDKIAFSAAGGGLSTINLDGSNRRQITEPGQIDYGAHWSPGGTDLVFTRTIDSDRDVYRVHANGVGVVRLTNTPSRSEVGPVWSPDGTKIAFAGCPNPLGNSDCGIYVINRDGSGETQVGGVAASFAENPLDWQALPPFPGTPPASLTVSLLAKGGTGTVASVPEGVACPPACSTEFDRGATVRLEARPTGSAVFLGWGGACTGRTSSCRQVMDADKRVTATFATMVRLNVTVRGPGRVVSAPTGIACPPRCTAAFAHGTRVTLRASPAKTASFASWGGACRATNRCRVTMNANRRVSARFRR